MIGKYLTTSSRSTGTPRSTRSRATASWLELAAIVSAKLEIPSKVTVPPRPYRNKNTMGVPALCCSCEWTDLRINVYSNINEKLDRFTEPSGLLVLYYRASLPMPMWIGEDIACNAIQRPSEYIANFLVDIEGQSSIPTPASLFNYHADNIFCSLRWQRSVMPCQSTCSQI